MDRLSALITGASLFVALGCGEGGSDGPAPPSRVVAVTAEAVNTDDLCDVTPSPAPELSFPGLADGASAPAGTGRRWLNVWATWCAPCVEEMPMLNTWQARFAEDGVEVELVFLSADSDAAAVDTFRAAHPDVPEGLRIADPSTIPAWATSVGLDEGATLPIHVLTDASGHVTCARTGGLRERDYDAVAAVLAR